MVDLPASAVAPGKLHLMIRYPLPITHYAVPSTRHPVAGDSASFDMSTRINAGQHIETRDLRNGVGGVAGAVAALSHEAAQSNGPHFHNAKLSCTGRQACVNFWGAS